MTKSPRKNVLEVVEVVDKFEVTCIPSSLASDQDIGPSFPIFRVTLHAFYIETKL